MGIIRYTVPMNLAEKFQLKIHHYARGTYPINSNEMLPFNRFFIPLKNPSGEKCRMEDQNHCFILKPGNVYFIPLNHKAAVILDDYLEFISIQFQLELYEGVDLFSRADGIREISNDYFHRKAIEMSEQKNLFYVSAKLHSLIFEFSVLLMKDMNDDDWEEVTKFSEFQKELDFLQENIHSLAKISINDLAGISGVNRETFSRKFSKNTGISPKKFLTRMILNHACRMLLKEKFTIKEIAENLGFNNEFYFSRFFRKQLGIPPGQYRNKYEQAL